MLRDGREIVCLQPFPPFIYFFFLTVLNIISLSLLREAKRFHCWGLCFRLSKELLRAETDGPWEGSFLG